MSEVVRELITFVGPVQEFGPKRKRRWSILVLQTGAPLQLDYDSEQEAGGARRALLQAPNAFAVPSGKLLGGIHKALQYAFAAGAQSEQEAGKVV